MKIEKEMIQKLKTETKNNPAATPVFHLLALRERTRSTLTLSALRQRMKEEGFDYTTEQYRELFKVMASVGLGTAVMNRVGTCVGIKDIRVSLAALGKAACDMKDMPEIKQRRREGDKHSDTQVFVKPITSLPVSINGKDAIIQFPNGLTASELSLLLRKMQGGEH